MEIDNHHSFNTLDDVILALLAEASRPNGNPNSLILNFLDQSRLLSTSPPLQFGHDESALNVVDGVKAVVDDLSGTIMLSDEAVQQVIDILTDVQLVGLLPSGSRQVVSTVITRQ